MAESDISISEMTNGTFSAGALFPAIQPSQQSGSGYSNVKMSGADIGDGIGQLQFPLRLETENKSIFGAINEAAKSIINFLPTDTASGSLASFPDGANGVPLEAIALNVTPAQSGSGDPSPSNVRPISGHDTAVITRTGANIWDEETERGAYNNQGEKIDYAVLRNKNPIKVEGLSSVYFHCGTTGVTARVVFYTKSNVCISSTPGTTLNAAITVPNNAAYMSFNLDTNYGITYINNVSINAPATNTAYNAFIAATRTAEFGQIIYGATINPLTGEGVIDKVIVDLSTFTLGTLGDVYIWYKEFDNILVPASNSEIGQVISEYYAPIRYNGVSGTPNTIAIRTNSYMYVNTGGNTTPQGNAVYKLATPVPFTFTPIENINTLYGANNIFQDAGDISVTYRADIGLYIAKKTA